MNIILITILTLCASLMCAAEYPPQWVLDGILYTETKSTYREDGTIRYVDKRRGGAGEYGPFQMTRTAFKDIRRKGEQFWMLETDTRFAEECAARYLMWIDKHYAHGNWDRAVEMYNAGPNKRSPTYLKSVKRHGGAQ